MPSIFDTYRDSLFIDWYTDDNGSKISIQRTNEQHKVVNNHIVITEVMDDFQGVQIDGMYQIPYEQEITNENYFAPHWTAGIIRFHPNKEGQTITISSYYSKGLIMYPISRIYKEVENNQVTETLETAEIQRDENELERISNENIRIQSEIQRVSNENTRQSQESDRQTNTTNAINNLNDAVDTSQLIFKSPVATFNDIITTYPTPELSWVVQTLDDSKYYRYDENSEWIYIQQIQLSQIDTKVSKLGDTMSDYLTLHADPTNPYHASTKQYTDTKLSKSGGDMTGNINMGENEINLGGFKIKHNPNLNSIDFEF